MNTTVSAAQRAGVTRLRAAGVPDPARDVRALLAEALEVRPDRLVLMGPDPVSEAVAAQFDAYLSAREAYQPVAQILGRRLFYGRAFRVTPAVLDPRPETECLIAEALRAPATHMLDIGTGSGCILLTLLAEWPEATGVATDASPQALDVARSNAELLAPGRATFVETNWAEGVTGPFDLILSNPPYITGAEMAGLSRDVREWEPHMALTPGPEGVESYRALIPQARQLLSSGGRLILEIGPQQGRIVSELSKNAGFEAVQVLPDFDGRDRLVAARAP